MTAKGANGRSSIYRDEDGWHGWVSFGASLDGRRRRKHVRGRTKQEVAAKVARLEGQRRAGYAGDRPVTVGEWLERWIENRIATGARPTTVQGYWADQRRIVAALGTVRLDRLSPEHIDGLWQTILAAGPGPATCAHVRRTLSAALNAAVDRGHLARNPLRLSKPPRYEPPEVEPLSTDDARRVLTVACARRNGVRWSVALALGLRQGEALGLRWADLDLEQRRLRVRVQLQHLPYRHGCAAVPDGDSTCGRDPGRCPARRGGGPMFVDVKSVAGRRVLGLPVPLVEQLRRHAAAQAAERLRAGSRWQDYGLVFAREDGSPIRKETDSAEWHRMLQSAGVRPARLHDARHTAATLLLVQGVPAGVAMRLLGHADTRVTARYQHVVEATALAAAEQISEALWG